MIVLRSLSVRGCIFFVVISFIPYPYRYTSFSSYRNQKTRQEESVMGLRLRVMRGDEKDLSKMELEQNVHHQICRFVCACTRTLIDNIIMSAHLYVPNIYSAQFLLAFLSQFLCYFQHVCVFWNSFTIRSFSTL